MSVLLETSLGNLVIDLCVDECPIASQNFLKLCKIKYYNFSKFHSVRAGFGCQTGRPACGGPGQRFDKVIGASELPFFKHERSKKLRHDKRGVISMVAMCESRGNPDALVHGSEFFIQFSDGLPYLNGRQTIFGHVVEGQEVLNSIERAVLKNQIDFVPLQDILIRHTYVLIDPFEDGPLLRVPEGSPSPPETLTLPGHLAEWETTDILMRSASQFEQRLKDSQTKALTLEIIGDLPSASIKPPENVLFVAKLNRATQDRDLRIIFSRFGQINNCDVIKDRHSGKSLGYAFVEFDLRADAEAAYQKMQNAYIDDRKVKVDFSQSVSQLSDEWRRNRQH